MNPVTLDFLFFTTSMLPLLLFVVKLMVWFTLAGLLAAGGRLLRAKARQIDSETRVYLSFNKDHVTKKRRWRK